MRLVVVSDTHGRTGILFDIVERHINNADLFVSLGDSEKQIEELLMVYPDLRLECVAGNCDFASTYPLYKVLNCEGKSVFITHGHMFYVKRGYELLMQRARQERADICLFGHTHIPHTEYTGNIYYMNPGAVCSNSYGIVDITPKGIMTYYTKI